jgi:isoleucyl-tRNA synthetase
VPFAELTITSALQLTHDAAPAEAFRLSDVPGVAVVFELAPGAKCVRCWQILPDVGMHAHPCTCARCNAALG